MTDVACESAYKLGESNIQSPGPGSQGTEQDSDSVWSTASEDRSDVESDPISSDSVSHELLTVRDKTGEGCNDIQQLISAAESLALERARLNLSSRGSVAGTVEARHSHPVDGNSSSTPKERTKTLSFAEPHCTPQLSFETDDSGYYSKTNSQGEVPSTSSLYNSEAEPITVFQQVLDAGCQYVSRFRKFDMVSQDISPISTKPNDPPYVSDPFLDKATEDQPTNVPNMAIDQGANTQTTSFYDDEIVVTKETKEVCNSSIKESHETCDVFQPVKKITFAGSSKSHGSLQLKNSVLEAKKVSLVVHDECSDLLRLALTSTSSFGRVLRLLRQVMTLQFGSETPRVAVSVNKELEEYETQHSYLEGQLSSKAAHLQSTLSQVQALETFYSELESEKFAIDKISLQILMQLEQALSSFGLHHMVAITSPRRRSLARNLEDAETALSLLLGELSRKTARCKNLEDESVGQDKEIEDLRTSLSLREERLLATKSELELIKEWSNSEINSLKYCLAQAEKNLAEIRMEGDRFKDNHKRKEDDDKAMIRRLQKQLSDIQQSFHTRVCHVENNLQDVIKEKLNAESALQDAQQKHAIQEQQMVLINEENKLLVDSLRSTLKHQQMEVEQVRLQLEQSLAEKQNITRRAHDIAEELNREQELHQRLQVEATKLRDTLRDMKQEFGDCEKNLHSKIDKVTEIRCDLERQIRSRDLKILHLHTELQLDGQRITTLTQDNDSLLQKVQNLQEKVWELTRRQRHSSSNSSRSGEDSHSVFGIPFSKRLSFENGSCASLLPGALDGSLGDQRYQELVKNVTDGQSREERLHKLLIEKDETIHGLQTSFASELAVKNQELEILRCKLSELEEQMGSLISGLQVSAAIGSVTTEVGLLLQERTENLENLNQSSHILHDEFMTLSVENQQLKKELASAKRDLEEMSGEVLESTRRAKEEARQERMHAARSLEKCSKLQAELDYTVAVLEQERQERQMKEMIQQFKFFAVSKRYHYLFMGLT